MDAYSRTPASGAYFLPTQIYNESIDNNSIILIIISYYF